MRWPTAPRADHPLVRGRPGCEPLRVVTCPRCGRPLPVGARACDACAAGVGDADADPALASAARPEHPLPGWADGDATAVWPPPADQPRPGYAPPRADPAYAPPPDHPGYGYAPPPAHAAYAPPPGRPPVGAGPARPAARGGTGATVGWFVLGVVLVGAVAAVAFLLGPRLGGGPDEPTVAVPTVAAGPTTAAQVPSVAPVADPERELGDQVAADAAVVEGLVGQWVPQVSSKQVGLVVGGVTYGFPEILADFRRWRASYPDAVLLRSGDFSSFRSPGFFVTVVAQPFGTPEAANAWCDGEGLAPGDCLAKRISRTDGPAGSTVPRG